MVRPVFYKKSLKILAATVALIFFATPGAFCQGGGIDETSYHNQRGMEYFKKGFYEHAPANQVTEAGRNYGLAVKEFEAAISKDASFTEAHKNLARVYYVQKNFEDAAKEYKRVTELDPVDIDAYVNLALAFIELKRTDEAIQALESAKRQVSDPEVLKTLDSYISKVRAQKEKEVR